MKTIKQCTACDHIETTEVDTCPKCEDSLIELEEISDRDLEERFVEFLDDCFTPFKVGYLEYPAGDTLKKVDLVAFRESFNNWLDAEISEGLYIEHNSNYYVKG
jgi:hypothetical protein